MFKKESDLWRCHLVHHNQLLLGKKKTKNEAGESAELSLGALAEITHTLGLLFLCCGSF